MRRAGIQSLMSETSHQRQPEGVTIQTRAVAVDWPDGSRGAYPFAWLRDSCACEACRHPGSGQRLLEPAAIPHDIHPAEAHLDGDDLLVAWAPDRHFSTYPGEWLRARASVPSGDHRRRWDAGIARDLPLADHAAIAADPRQLRRWLALVDSLGFGVLSGVPISDGEVARVAGLFAHVRTTNYGRVFDVRSVVEPANLAYTPLGLGAHTDNPVPRPRADAAAAALPVLERPRRREHARRRLLRRRGAARRAARPTSRCSRATRSRSPTATPAPS